VTPPTTCTAPTATPTTAPVEVPEAVAGETLEGWQLLAMASLGRLLTTAELAACEQLPAELALDLLFPGLHDAARHEALSTLG
jgi:hypothetical protein